MVRIAPPRSAAALLLVFGLSTAAHAQDRVVADDGASAPAARPPAVATHPDRDLNVPIEQARQRPPALIPLYASFVALEALDIHSTRRALGSGAVEANPAMRGLTGSSVGIVAVKAAGAAGLIFASEKIWKKNRAAAVVLMVATNSAMTWVVAHNYHAVR
jgi:hypothetical protein